MKSVWSDVTVSTGDSAVIPIAWAWSDRKLLDVTYIPLAAFALDGTNYWSFNLVIYDEEGNEKRSVSDSLLELNTFPLAIAKPLLLPYYGHFEEIGVLWERGQTLCLKPVESGTAADASLRVQAHFILGRE